MSFNQLAPTVPTILNCSNCFVFSNSSSGNALSVQQLGAGNVATFRTTTGATALFVGANGNVGVGTTNPAYTLDVIGAGRFNTGTSNVFVGAGQGAGQGGFFMYPQSSIAGSSWNLGCGLQGSYSNAITFVSGTNIGIGTTNPQGLLEVGNVGTGSDPTYTGSIRICADPGSSLNANGGLEFKPTTFSSGYGWRLTSADWTGGNTPLVFQARAASATWSNVMTILNSGRVGVGTTSPACTFHMYQSQAGAPATSGSTDANIAHRIHVSSIGVDTGVYGGGYAWIQPRNATNYATNYGITLCPNGGNVGIGTNNPSYPLHVLGSTGRAAAFKYLTYSSAPNWTADSFSIALGALVNSCIATNDAFVVFSDSRIKIEEQAPQSYLELVSNVNVKNFSYIDKIQYGPQKKMGFFAQEVEKVLPDAVSKICDFIPNIFRKCSAEGNCVTITDHGLTEGTRIRIIKSDNVKNDFDIHVVDENTVQVDTVLENEVFVFGTEVDDFRVLNNDYMSAVGFGGLKELHALVKTQQTTIEMLTERLSALEAKLNSQ